MFLHFHSINPPMPEPGYEELDAEKAKTRWKNKKAKAAMKSYAEIKEEVKEESAIEQNVSGTVSVCVHDIISITVSGFDILLPTTVKS